MFKTVNNLVPEYVCDKFASVNTIHRHNLRGAQHNLFIPRPEALCLFRDLRPSRKVFVKALFTTHLNMASPLIVIIYQMLHLASSILNVTWILFPFGG